MPPDTQLHDRSSDLTHRKRHFNESNAIKFDSAEPVWIKASVVKKKLDSSYGCNDDVDYQTVLGTSKHYYSRKTHPAEWDWLFGYVVKTGLHDGLSKQSALSPLDINHVSSPHNSETTTSPFGSFTLRKTGRLVVEEESTSSRKRHVPKIYQPKSVCIQDEWNSIFNGQVVDLNESEVESSILPANQFQNEKQMVLGNLIELTHLHEPSLIQSLKARYDDLKVYTFCGNILLALNPFQTIDGLYSDQVMSHYITKDCIAENDVSSEPHVYAIAQQAFNEMKKAFEISEGICTCRLDQDIKIDQSILVSGESGAGKTVTTKVIMKFLAKLSEQSISNQSSSGSKSIEQQVLQSNPILESFGNARTVRNDNSSRFGKFIEIQFHRSGRLEGASISTYLLEKVRLLRQGENERNFHIFYELLEGLNQHDSVRTELGLQGYEIRDFRITASSGVFDRRDGIKDSESFNSLQSAMSTVGFTDSEKTQIFKVISGLLHMSNLKFVEMSSGAVVFDDECLSLGYVLDIFGVDKESLTNAVCKSTINVGNEIVQKNLSFHKAQKALEALMKATYGALFELVVKKINTSITIDVCPDDQFSRSDSTETFEFAFIKILDIFGFESFEVNSFEQLCINYCNESLQQQFNRHIFKREQEEYEREGITWSFISFPDNQDILDVIDQKKYGLFSILDEQCKLAMCTDQTFANATYEKFKCGQNMRISSNRNQQARGQFSIQHYAGNVEYSTESFLDKNKDELPKEATEFLLSTSVYIFHEIGKHLDLGETRPMTALKLSNSLVKSTVANQFSSQLKKLRDRIDLTNPHYIRCLKPNHQLVPSCFVPGIIAEQLRYCGVLEAVRISRSGFPQRYSKGVFYKRYSLLGSVDLTLSSHEHRNFCEMLVEDILKLDSTSITRDVPGAAAFDIKSTDVQIGKTKVFLRQSAFDSLEFLRVCKLNSSAKRLQTIYRTFAAQRRYVYMVKSIIKIQSYYRCYSANRQVQRIRLHKQLVLVQSLWRRFYNYKLYRSKLYAILWCQRYFRGNQARKQNLEIKRKSKCVLLQSWWRMYNCRNQFLNLRNLACNVQHLFRAKQARYILVRLRVESKSHSAVTSERDDLRKKNAQLQNEIKSLKMTGASSPCICSIYGGNDVVGKISQEMEILKSLLRDKELICESQQKEIDALQKEVSMLRQDNIHHDPCSTRQESPPPSDSESVSSRTLNSSNLMKLANYSIQTDSTYLNDSFATNRSQGIYAYHFDTPIHSAVRAADDDALSIAITNCDDVAGDINRGGEGGRTPLHLAILISNLSTATFLLQNDSVANTQDDAGNTPLHYASNCTAVKLLLEVGGANPNIPNNVGYSAIHVAVQRRDVQSVKLLLNHSAKVNVADNIKWLTPLHLIAQENSLKSDENSGEKILEIARVLSDGTGADLNYQDKAGNTPLHHAAVLVHQYAGELINILLKKGANPNVANNRGQTPMHLLLHNTRLRRFAFFPDLVQFILFNGYDTNLQSLNGCAPIHLAIYHQDFDSAIQLLEREAQLHLSWTKPARWASHWNEIGSSQQVLCMDMISDQDIMHQLFSSISSEQTLGPSRPYCMQCKKKIGAFGRKNCRHCGCLLCLKCAPNKLDTIFFPPYCEKVIQSGEPMRVCLICEDILISRKEDSDGVLGREVYIPTSRHEDISMLDLEGNFHEDSHVLSLLK